MYTLHTPDSKCCSVHRLIFVRCVGKRRATLASCTHNSPISFSVYFARLFLGFSRSHATLPPFDLACLIVAASRRICVARRYTRIWYLSTNAQDSAQDTRHSNVLQKTLSEGGMMQAVGEFDVVVVFVESFHTSHSPPTSIILAFQTLLLC